MAATIKKNLKTILPIALGIFLVWYSYATTAVEDRRQIIYFIRQADLFWVSISIFLGILGHISRAIRWNYMLAPLGYTPKLQNNVLIILVSYFANLGIPRTGEVLRATALRTYEGVPFEKGFGTILTERIIDVVMLFIVVFLAFILQTEVIIEVLNKKGFDIKTLFLFLAVAITVVGGCVLFIKRSTIPLAVKVRNFASGLLDGVLSIFKMKKKGLFLLHTLFIWTCYIGMLWIIKFTVPETEMLTLSQLLVAFVAGAFAMAATNGGIGLYPIAVSNALALFGISVVSGDAFGWIIWISQTIMIVVFGAISFLLLPLLNRK